LLQIKGIHFKRFENGKLMKVLKDFIDSEKINGGLIFVLGFLNGVTLNFFDWEKKTYKELTIEKGLEITSCYGNIARKENDECLIHMHGTFSDEEGRVYGGHVKNGEIKLVEVMIVETEKLSRRKDEETGLYLLDV